MKWATGPLAVDDKAGRQGAEARGGDWGLGLQLLTAMSFRNVQGGGEPPLQRDRRRRASTAATAT